MNSQKAWRTQNSVSTGVLARRNAAAQSDVHGNFQAQAKESSAKQDSMKQDCIRKDYSSPEAPWISPRTVTQQSERQSYLDLKDRLAKIPSRSKQKRQTLYIDLWTGQHWLGLTLSYPEGYEILKPVNVDTALSIATIGTYRLLNQPLFAEKNHNGPCNQRRI